MLALIVAGEVVFGLPFHTARFFRPTLLEVFGFTNTQLGDLFAVYGITAMIAYFPGGALADRYSARFLLTASLFATAVGGLFMATIPTAMPMAILYGYWGATTVFLFWGALIRATREWGGRSSQGMAFGVLEGGRGLVAALVSTFALIVFAAIMPENVGLASDEVRRTGMRSIIFVYSAVAFAAGVFTWLTVPVADPGNYRRSNPLQGMRVVMRRPIIWAQAAVIICAYCGYKGLDNYSLYAVQVLGMDEVRGAALSTYGAWVRPVAAVAAGLIADRFSAVRSIGVAFAVLLLAYATLAMTGAGPSSLNIIYANLFVSFFAVFALRGIYFALLEENRTPKFLTGAAVGMVSLVGYTPEIFFAPIAGRILDANPGLVGHQNYFWFLASIATLGILTAVWVLWLQRRGQESLWPETRSSERPLS
jgi:sugar phosphate permease